MKRYVVASAAVAVAVLVRVALTPIIGGTFPLVTMFPATVFAVWYGGWRPAVFAAVAGFVAIEAWVPPGAPLTSPMLADAVSAALYLTSCAAIIVLGEAMRSAERGLAAGQRERSAANLALESRVEAQSLLAAIVASSEDAIVSKTLEGRITSWNKGAERLFGYTAAEAIGQSIMLLVPPDQHAQELAVLEQIRRGQRVDHLEVVRVTKAGERRDISLTVSPVHDRHGHVIGASKTARDVTERKAAEARLQRSEEASARAVAALQEADRRKDDFLATLAHELRNPLAPIASGLYILRAAGDDQAAAAQAREIMERQVAQMVRLVDDLLDVARITTGKVAMRIEPMDLAGAISDAIETATPPVTAGGQTLAVTTPDEPIYVYGDRTRLAQVFANLLNNSARYSARGQAIALTVTRDGDTAVVRVRDEGVGIDADMLPRVFEMFRQADGTGGRSRGGLGIGLSLVKRIVELHGGTVEATSPGLGQGAEFIVRIPARAQGESGVAADGAGTVPADTVRRRILIVDDNTDAAKSLGVVLALSGHETRLAHDGEAALVTAEDFRPDIIFLDLGMPNVDGHETARRLREQTWGQSLVIVALTGWGQAEDRRRSKEAGFDHHLVKPADPAVVSTLLAALSRRDGG